MNKLTRDDFRKSENGQAIERCLESPVAVEAMVTLAGAGRSPIEALDSALPDDMHLVNAEKHHAGRMVRDVMNRRGWKVAGQSKFPGGRIFSSGSTYKTYGRQEPAADQREDFRQRLAQAQEIIEKGSKNAYSVDDFIHDKRAEAARETARDARKYGL